MKSRKKLKDNKIFFTMIVVISLLLLLSSSAFAIYLVKTLGEKKLSFKLNLLVTPQEEEILTIDPKLVEGMIPVVWDETESKWKVTTKDDPEWFNYDQKKWANVMMPDGSNSAYSVGDTISDNDLGSMFVWIPRYEYKINYYTDSTKTTISDTQTYYGSIDIQFIKINQITPDDGYKIHPAFKDGYIDDGDDTNDFKNGEWDKEIAGFWFAKFETTDSLQIKPNTYNTSKIDISTMYNNSRNKTYGLPTNIANQVNPHMMKNSEWGAMAYLSYSSYGINGENIYVNNFFQAPKAVSGYYATTYNAAQNNNINTLNYYSTDNGQKGSSTWNIYGIYDIVGGRTEYTAGYLKDISGDSQIIKDEGTKYCTAYDISNNGNTEETIKNSSTPGDAIGETFFWNKNAVGLPNGNGGTPTANLLSADRPCIARGGAMSNGAQGAGLMSFWTLVSGASQYRTTREILIVE